MIIQQLIHPKKSFRIQFRKKDLSNFNRTLDYVLPRDTSLVNTYMGYYIARMMGILTPDVRFVNLYINDKLQGLYLEVERTKRIFSEKRNLMPVNIYSGSPLELIPLYHLIMTYLSVLIYGTNSLYLID